MRKKNVEGLKKMCSQTGDNVIIYIVMMVISASALIFIAVKKKWMHKKGVMSLVLCFTFVLYFISRGDML